MNLTQTLQQIATDFDLDAKQLIDYANEDTQTGWDDNKGAWPIGSLWQVEGQILYSLVRFTKPKRVLELGTMYGCSATHMLMALKANQDGGHLDCVDRDIHEVGVIGGQIPNRLRDNLTIYEQDVYEYVAQKDDKLGYDFVFSDAAHASEKIVQIWSRREKLVNPSGFLIEHDACHFMVGSQVMAGISAAGVTTVKTYLTEPSDCGMALWQRGPMPDDYNLTAYNTLWAMTGPEERNMREWIRESTGKKAKPKKSKLVELMEEWDGLQRE